MKIRRIFALLLVLCLLAAMTVTLASCEGLIPGLNGDTDPDDEPLNPGENENGSTDNPGENGTGENGGNNPGENNGSTTTPGGNGDNSNSGGSGNEGTPSHTHTLTKTDRVEATCTANGNTEYYTCSGCSKIFSDTNGANEITDAASIVIPAAHKLTFVAAIDATCTTEGSVAYYTCSACEKNYTDENGTAEITDVVVATNGNHTGGTEIRNAKAATEEEAGYTGDTYCLGCGQKTADGTTIGKLDHTHSMTKTDAKSSSCTVNGNIEYYTCSKCEKLYADAEGIRELTIGETVVPASHTLVHHESKSKTCTTDGNIEYWTCSSCLKVFSDVNGANEIDISDTVIKASHNYEGGECTACGETNFSSGFVFELINNDTEYEIYSVGSCTDRDIIIPPSYHGLPVTSIGVAAFEECKKVKSIFIPSSIKRIGAYAFENCISLEKIIISSGVTTIEDYAFYYCSALKKVEIPNTVTYIGDFVFNGCKSLVEMTVPFIGSTNEATAASEKTLLGYFFGTDSFTDSTAVTQMYSASSSITYYIPDSLRIVTVNGGNVLYGAFYGCQYLTNVRLSDSITSIGHSTFKDCTALADFTISNKVTLIANSAFYNCTNLANVIFDENSTLLTIENCAFYNCAKIGEITLPDSVTYIGFAAFNNCSSLKSIRIGNAVDSLVGSLLSGCSSLESITIPFIGKSAAPTTVSGDTLLGYLFGFNNYNGAVQVKQFYGTGTNEYNTYYIPSTLKSVTLSGGQILYGAFYGCSMLKSINIPESVTSIGNYAFYDCTALEEIFFNATAMNDLSSYNNYSFYNAGKESNGIKVVIGKNVTKIPAYLFYPYSGNLSYAPKITSVEFEEGSICENIGVFAFYNCTALEEIYFGATAMNDLDYRNYVFYDAGKNGDGIRVVIGKNVTKIPAYLFCPYERDSSYAPKIISVEFESGSVCESIGESAFAYCTNLTEVHIPDISKWCEISFGSASANPLYYGTKLYIGDNLVTNLIIPSGVTSISDYAFICCKKLANITMPESVTSIGNEAFAGCTSLTSINIPESVTSIGKYTFNGCTSLSEVHISDISKWCEISLGNALANPLYYGAKLYIGDNLVTNLIIPADVTSIDYKFYHCSSLVNVTFEDGSLLKTIGHNAFFNCMSISSITIPKGVISIGDGAFRGCTSLSNITMPESVTSIGNDAFAGCTSLTSITIPESVTSIGEYAFDGCTGLEEIYFKATAMNDLSSNENYVFSHAGKNGDGIKVVIGKNVTKIPVFLFSPYYYDLSYTPKIVSVDFESGSVCESIGESAFYGCTSLTSITIPASVTSIGGYTFYGCTRLEEIYFNATSMKSWSYNDNGFCNAGKNGNGIKVIVGKNVRIIPKLMFYRAYIKNVEFEEGSICESIGESAFCDCTSLTSITIPESVTSIGYRAFDGCTSLTSITISASVTSIGDSAFYGCTSLQEIYFDATAMNDLSSKNFVFFSAGNNSKGINVVIGKNVTKIPAYLFYPYSGNSSYAPKITSVEFEEGSSCKSVGYYAFRDCTSLSNITIPESVTSIGNDAFAGCESLTSITIPEGVTSIGPGAFYCCTSLSSITIPQSVTFIGGSAFYDCTAFEEIYFNATAMDDLKSSNDVFYNAGKDESGIKVVIGKNVTKIPAYLFSSSPKITIVEFESGSVCKDIGYDAFSGCKNLASITIPESVTSISGYMFYRCTSLSSITIPQGVTSIGDYAFYGCTSLSTITISKGVTSIAHYAFAYCKSLTSITFEEGSLLETIGNYAFYECTSLSSITISESVTSIGDHAFYNCTSLSNVTFEEGSLLETIGNYAFYDCSSLSSIAIPGSVTSIGDAAFRGCSGLSSITIPASVTSIGSYAFYDCTNLTSVTFDNPNGWWYAASSSATSGTAISSADLEDHEKAAEYLISTHVYYYWRRG